MTKQWLGMHETEMAKDRRRANMEFVHPELFEEITAIGGHYTFIKEATLQINGRRVLYFIGSGIIDTSCCGTSGCIYAYVPGYLIERKSTRKDRVSIIEPVNWNDSELILDILKKTELVTQAVFLTENGSARIAV